MAMDPTQLSAPVLDFLAERHLATLSIARQGESPHVAPVGFTWDDDRQLARVITWSGSQKVKLLDAGGRVSLCQVDGGRWLTLEGTAAVTADSARCADAVGRYAQRYSQPKDRGPDRRTIEVAVDKLMGRA